MYRANHWGCQRPSLIWTTSNHSTRCIDRSLMYNIRWHWFQSVRMLQYQWGGGGAACASHCIVSRRLNGGRLWAKMPLKKSLLTVRHRRANLRWARRHTGHNIRYWRRVHFNDESRFKLCNNDGRTMCGGRMVNVFILLVSSNDMPTEVFPSLCGGVFALIANSPWSKSMATWPGYPRHSNCATPRQPPSAVPVQFHAWWGHTTHCEYHEGPTALRSHGRIGLAKQKSCHEPNWKCVELYQMLIKQSQHHHL